MADQPQGDKLIAEVAKASEQTYATTSLTERKAVQHEVRTRQLRLDELNSSLSSSLKHVSIEWSVVYTCNTKSICVSCGHVILNLY